MTEPTLTPHSNHPSMLNREQPAPFVIVRDTPGGALTVPTTSARVAARAARQLTEHCPRTQATWHANPHAGPGPVAVFGCARPPAGEHQPHQDTEVESPRDAGECGQVVCGAVAALDSLLAWETGS